MWDIIHGNQPFFYVKNTGSNIILIDGLKYHLYGGEPILTLPGDYPQGTYTYNGSMWGKTDVHPCHSMS